MFKQFTCVLGLTSQRCFQAELYKATSLPAYTMAEKLWGKLETVLVLRQPL